MSRCQKRLRRDVRFQQQAAERWCIEFKFKTRCGEFLQRIQERQRKTDVGWFFSDSTLVENPDPERFKNQRQRGISAFIGAGDFYRLLVTWPWGLKGPEENSFVVHGLVNLICDVESGRDVCFLYKSDIGVIERHRHLKAVSPFKFHEQTQLLQSAARNSKY